MRQNLIMESKTAKPALKAGRYFKYAIGEILLVVIGILIALQINNWNEDRKLAIEEQTVLKGLKREFEQNLEEVKKDYDRNLDNSKAARELLNIINGKEIPSAKIIDSLFYELYSWKSFDASKGVIDETIYSGKLNIIKDENLRYLLTQWSGIISNTDEDIDIRVKHMVETVFPYLCKHYPLKNMDKYYNFKYLSNVYNRLPVDRSKFQFDAKMFANDAELEGLIYLHVVNQDYILLNDLDLIDYLEKVLLLINKKLNHNE